MSKKDLRQGQARLQNKVGSILKKATFSSGDSLPRDLLGIAFSNVGKVRRDVLDVVFQEIGRYVQDFADNYTIKVKAEFNFERKDKKSRGKR